MAKKRSKRASTATPRPRAKPAQVVTKAVDAVGLAKEDREILEPRLPPGMIDGANADLGLIGVVVAGAVEGQAEKTASTVTQNDVAAGVMRYVLDIRTSLINGGLSAAAKKRYGVGLDMNVGTIKTITAGANTLLKQAELTPDEIRGAGVLPADLEKLRTWVTSLTGADLMQEGKKRTAKLSTAERDTTIRRLEDSIRRIAAAGLLAHTENPTRRGMYEALLAGPTKTKKSGNGGGGGG